MGSDRTQPIVRTQVISLTWKDYFRTDPLLDTIHVQESFLHPDYSDPFNNDISLLRVVPLLSLSPRCPVVHIASSSLVNEEELIQNETVFITDHWIWTRNKSQSSKNRKRDTTRPERISEIASQ